MKNDWKFLMFVAMAGCILLAACGKPSEESSAQSANQTQTESETQKANDDTRDQDLAVSEDTSTTKEESPKSGQEMKDLTKDEYLKKLNEMEEADRNEEVKTTIAEMEEQEAERYKKWDKELNFIYGFLQEQLDAEQMSQLRDEQRNWIMQRDLEAKESSLKYKGGTTEALEFVATQASLTRERCFLLVARYMK